LLSCNFYRRLRYALRWAVCKHWHGSRVGALRLGWLVWGKVHAEAEQIRRVQMKQRFLWVVAVVSVLSAGVLLATALLQLLVVRKQNRELFGAVWSI
jgi:hypothetical protein